MTLEQANAAGHGSCSVWWANPFPRSLASTDGSPPREGALPCIPEWWCREVLVSVAMAHARLHTGTAEKLTHLIPTTVLQVSALLICAEWWANWRCLGHFCKITQRNVAVPACEPKSTWLQSLGICELQLHVAPCWRRCAYVPWGSQN